MSLGRLDHFEVLRFLDGGGMGDVYLAHDEHLDCDVALKVLREEPAGVGSHRTRLLGEARSLAKLDHANIVGILDCGEAAPDPPGFLWPDQPGPHPEKVVYLAMRFVEGVDLSEALASRRLPLERAVDWAIQIAAGLEAAHARGVVHRDLKPGNIRVTPDGVLKIVDFGLAGSLRSRVDSLARTESLTREIVLGTVGYGAPEQAERADHTDPRCDLFSLGVILYEMVSGQPPFVGDSAVEVLREVQTADPPPMARFARHVPPELERIVAKLLEKDPRNRYQSAHEVRTDLEKLPRTPGTQGLKKDRPPRPSPFPPPVLARLVLVLVLAAAAAAVAWLLRPRPETLVLVEFENLTKDPALDLLAKGLTFDLETSLVQFCKVNIVVSTLKERDGTLVRDPDKVAREYGATSVLIGSLMRVEDQSPGGSLKLHLRIVHAANHSTAHAWDFHAPQNNPLAIVRDLTAQVVAILPRLNTANAAALDDAAARRWPAQEAYLRGLALFWHTDPALRDSAGVEFDRALALEPDFGRALAGRARVELADYLRDRDTTRLGRAERDARAAAAMPASEIEGRIALGRILRERGRTAESIAELLAASHLNGRNAEPYTELGMAYAKLGDMDLAREAFGRSVEIQPRSPRAWRAYGRFLMQTVSDLPAAENAFRKELQLTPDRNRGYETVAAVLSTQCRYKEALAMYAKRPHPEQRSLDLYGNRGTAYYFNGQYDLALRDFLDAVGGMPEDGDWRVNLGDVYEHLGRRDEALKQYRLAVQFFGRDRAVDPENLVARSHEAKALAKAGECPRALLAADSCAAAGPWGNADVVHDLAMVYAICGDRDRAIAALDTLVLARGFSACLVGAEDEFAGLHDDPQFKKLVGL